MYFAEYPISTLNTDAVKLINYLWNRQPPSSANKIIDVEEKIRQDLREEKGNTPRQNAIYGFIIFFYITSVSKHCL